MNEWEKNWEVDTTLTARAQRINSILKTMSKFMFSKMTQAYT